MRPISILETAPALLDAQTSDLPDLLVEIARLDVLHDIFRGLLDEYPELGPEVAEADRQRREARDEL